MARTLGLGTLVETQESGESGHDELELIINATPPARERELVDNTALADDLETNAAGIELASEFTFTHYWEPGNEDTQDEYMDDLFDSKDIVPWRVRYQTVPETIETFSGWVSRLGPVQIEKGSNLTREVTIQRTTAITRT